MSRPFIMFNHRLDRIGELVTLGHAQVARHRIGRNQVRYCFAFRFRHNPLCLPQVMRGFDDGMKVTGLHELV
ncbi:MAG: hypothetical protein HQL37_11800 [Alphaproteobacteria bacterium]|nr:hypothetical protein [Alphaproteobacteria bacterium]